jgi:hypothetical protein
MKCIIGLRGTTIVFFLVGWPKLLLVYFFENNRCLLGLDPIFRQSGLFVPGRPSSTCPDFGRNPELQRF